MSELFEQMKRLVLSMNTVNDRLPEETRERCAEMLKKTEPLLVFGAIAEGCADCAKKLKNKIDDADLCGRIAHGDPK